MKKKKNAPTVQDMSFDMSWALYHTCVIVVVVVIVVHHCCCHTLSHCHT